MKQITVILVDDHTVVRQGLRILLEAEGNFNILGEAGDGLEAIVMAEKLHPEIIIMDLAIPKLNGLEAARRILQQTAPPPTIIILSAHADDAYIEQVASLGVQGYLVKQSSTDILVKAIKEIHKGRNFYSPSLDSHMHDHLKKGPGPTTRFSRAGHRRKNHVELTTREREVLQLVAEGRSNKEVSSDLGISIKTVEKHRQSVMRKLDLHDTSGLTRYAISAGIIENSVQCTIL